MTVYLDASAIVKLVVEERASTALASFLSSLDSDRFVTSALSKVEVLRALHAGGSPVRELAERQLARLNMISLSDDVLERASQMAPDARLRSLDALHLASAQLLAEDLRHLVTYDERMLAAGASLGLPVLAPA